MHETLDAYNYPGRVKMTMVCGERNLNNETPIALYHDGVYVKTVYDSTGNEYKRLLYEGYERGYTTKQYKEAMDYLKYYTDLVEDMVNHTIIKEDNDIY